MANIVPADDLPDSIRPVPADDLPDPASKQRSFWQDLARVPGLTARAGIEGAAALPNMVGNAVGLNSSQALSNLLTRIGLPQAENTMERIGQAGAQGLAGAATGIGLGGLMSQAASPIAQGVGAMLQQRPLVQMVGGVTGGVSGQTAAESGAGPVGQLAASMAGGSAPFIQPPRATNPNVQLLADRGVQMTPGQMLGGELNRLEEAASKWPVVGAPITVARNKSMPSFVNAGLNDALKIVKEKPLSPGTTGNAAVAYTAERLGEKFDETLARTGGDLYAGQARGMLPTVFGQPLPAGSLMDELNSLKSMGHQGLSSEAAAEFDRVIAHDVVSKFTQAGKASGQTLNDVMGDIRNLSQTKGRDKSADERRLGRALKEVGAAIWRMIERQNPDEAPNLQAAKAAWAKYKIAERAASSPAAKEGVYTPSQYNQAVRAKDPSKDHSAFSRGTANQQDLAQAGKDVLPNKLPDSGTPYRLGVMDMVFGEGLMSILKSPFKLGAMMAPQAIYNEPMLRLLQRSMTGQRPVGGLAPELINQAAQQGGMQGGGLQ